MQLLENADWVEKNFGGCDLGHVKRTERLGIMARKMLECPEASLTQQNPEWSDLKAAYRLCDRKEVTFDAVASFHWELTKQTQPGRYLLISDTTDLDHFSHKSTSGLGMLGNGSGRGMQLHNCLVVDSSRGTVEGQAGALVYYRKLKPKNETRAQRLRRSRESDLWGNRVDKVGPPPASCQWIHVFDRGGDNFEIYFRTLKSGCRIEERYFEDIDAVLNCLAVCSIVAWKVLYLCHLSRECPDIDCEVVFEPCQWKPVYMAIHRKEPPKTPPTLHQMVKMIAMLGGYVVRKSTQPGIQTLWLGL